MPKSKLYKYMKVKIRGKIGKIIKVHKIYAHEGKIRIEADVSFNNKDSELETFTLKDII